MATMVINEQMLSLTRELIDKREVTESTANAYVRNLYILNGKKPFKTLTFLKNTDGIDEKVGQYADNTQKAIYSAIVSVLSLFKDKSAYKKVYQHYVEKMTGKRDEVKEKTEASRGKKTEKEEKNWISWEEVSSIRDDLRRSVDEFKNKKALDTAQYEVLLKSLVLGLYTFIQPRRNQDYLDMMVVRGEEPASEEHNYVLLDKKGIPKQFVFNKYKTSKKYGKQHIDLTPELADIVTIYLKHHPLLKGKKKTTEPSPFLVAFDGKPLEAVNSITRLLNKVFGKAVGSSMLRHIYLSSKYDIKEMTEDAEKMGHSVEEQKAYLRGSSTNEVVVPTLSDAL